MLDFVGVHREAETIERALAHSSSTHAKACHDALLKACGIENPKVVVIRRGKDFEWKEGENLRWAHLGNGYAASVMADLGYDVPQMHLLSLPPVISQMIRDYAPILANLWYDRLYGDMDMPSDLRGQIIGELAECCRNSWFVPSILIQFLGYRGHGQDILTALEGIRSDMAAIHPAYKVESSVRDCLQKWRQWVLESTIPETVMAKAILHLDRVMIDGTSAPAPAIPTPGQWEGEFWAMISARLGYHRVYIARRRTYCILADVLDRVFVVINSLMPALGRLITRRLLSVRARHY